jgi:thiol-disulfide isomerase/thioredoxin
MWISTQFCGLLFAVNPCIYRACNQIICLCKTYTLDIDLQLTFVICMLKLILPLVFATSSALCGQTIESIKLSDLQKTLQSPNERILVINFWATWCAPCIKELPLFEKLHQENSNAQVMLVSMDYDLDPDIEKVVRFQNRKKLQAKIFFLTETDPNSWIDSIDKRWSGALPATLVINTKTKKREFVQGELKEGQLDDLIKKVNN